MTKKFILPALLLSVGLYGCGVTDYLGDDKEKPPLPGERISVLDSRGVLRPDETAKVAGFSMPQAWQNDSWAQVGGKPDHSMQNLALSSKGLQKVWSASIGDGSKSRLPLTTQPIVAGKSIFTLDTDSMLSAFSAEDGKRRWSVSVRQPDEEDPVISGGIAFDNGLLYVTAGYDEVVALDAGTGEVKWRGATSAPSRAAPTVINGRVFVSTMNNSLVALNANDGKQEWEFSGLGESTGLIGAASPAAVSDLVIPAFSSGELYALRAANGSVAWSDNLASSTRLGGVSGLSDIRGLPVVDNNIAYAISFGGKMVAVDTRTGARIWQTEISSAKTPSVVGNRIFVISSQSQIAAFDKDTGTVVWVSQLARYEDPEKKSGTVLWTSPIFAGGRLLAFSTDGRAAEIDPSAGTLLREWQTGEVIKIAPVIANGTLYLLSEDGDLLAYR